MANPCQVSLNELRSAYKSNPEFKKLVNSALNNIQHLPAEYPDDNPSLGADFDDLKDFFTEWCVFLPSMQGGHDDGLEYIQKFARGRGTFMDSRASTDSVEV